MKKIKRIGAMICTIALCFCMMAPSSHAAGLLGGQSFGAWMLAGLVSFNTVVSALNAPAGQDMDLLRQWQANPYSATNPYYQYPFKPLSMSEAMNLSTIRVRQGVVNIDGVDYDELWVSGEGARKLIPNLFDFKTKWAIMSNNAGTLATGAGDISGTPVYNVSGFIRTPTFQLNGYTGTWQLANDIFVVKNVDQYGRFQNANNTRYNTFPVNYGSSNEVYLYAQTSPAKVYASINQPKDQSGYVREINWVTYNQYAFQFDYVSGIVPAEESDIPEDYGMAMRIPHEKLETFYNTYPEYNVDNTTINIAEDEVDIDELTQAIFDMIDSMDEIKAEWTNGEQPEPPAPVDPIENIDQNVEDITQYQQDMQQQVDHMHQDVEAIHQTQQTQQQTQQAIAEKSESIDSTLKDVKDAITPGELTPRKFDLRRLFPFCIPFDIHNMLQKFDAEPQAPHVQIPFVIESIGFNYTIDLDFSAFDGLAQTLRTLELIVYCIGLAWATSKVIKW